MVKMKLIVLVVLVALVAGGFLLTRSLKQQRAAAAQQSAQEQLPLPVDTQQAQLGEIRRSFIATGTVEAQVDIGIVTKMPGKVARVLVDEGDRVRAGQLLAVLEHKDLRSQVQQAQAAVAAAEARVKQAQTGVGLQEAQTSTSIASAEAQLQAAQARVQQAQTTLEITTTQTATSVEQAEEGLKQAQARLDMTRTGARPQERQQAKEAVRQAQANRDTAKKNLARGQKLLEQGAIAQQQYDAAKLQYDVTVAGYNTAVQQLDLLEEGARSEEIRIAEAQVAQAQAAVSLARANQAQQDIRQRDVEAAQQQVDQARAGLEMAEAATARNEISQEDVQAAKAAVAQAESNISYLQTQIGYAHIRAPTAGTIAERLVDPGESAVPGVPMFRLVNNSQVYVRARVGEMNIGHLNKGQRVKVTVDALEGAEFAGTVTEVLPAADVESRAFDVKVYLPNPKGDLKPGMFARVEVITERQSDVVVVPREAIIQRGNQSFIYLAEKGQAVEKEVKTGLHDAQRTAILSGLKPGDEVVMRGQDQLKPGERIQTDNTGVRGEP